MQKLMKRVSLLIFDYHVFKYFLSAVELQMIVDIQKAKLEQTKQLIQEQKRNEELKTKMRDQSSLAKDSLKISPYNPILQPSL